MSERFSTGRFKGDAIRVYVDLKWACWSRDPGYWEEYAPETLKTLREGIEGGMFAESGESLVIHSAPRKECRTMSVTLKPEGDRLRVYAEGETFWDDLHDLADTLGLPVSEDGEFNEIDIEALREILPVTEEGNIGHRTDQESYFDLDTVTLGEVLARVDDMENTLVTEDETMWDEVKRVCV